MDICGELDLSIAGWHVSADDWSGLPMVDLLPALSLRQPGGAVYLFHDGAGDPLETKAAIAWLLRHTRDRWPAVTLSHYAKYRPCPSIAVQEADPLGDWTGLSIADLIRTGRV